LLCALKEEKMFSDNNIHVLGWTGNSPDLNPIESLWRLLKMKLGKKNYKNAKNLCDGIREALSKQIVQADCS